MTIHSVFDLLSEFTYDFLRSISVSVFTAKVLNVVILAAVIFGLSWVIDKTLNLLLTQSLRSLKSSKLQPFFLALIRNQVIRKTANLVPLIVFYNAVPSLFRHFPHLTTPGLTIINILIILLVTTIFKRIFRSITDVAATRAGIRDKPLESYQQVINIIINFIAVILIFSQVTGKEVWTFFTAMGAMSAVLMLVFKDTIMGFVASIQVTTNDTVRIGDWVEMPKYGADGDVIEITLNTVKIQNFDKTITTIPTYSLISDSFKNWRGMKETGGRRVKRAISIKMSSVKFLSDEELTHFQKISLLAPILQKKEEEISAHNRTRNVDKSILLNGRNLTNLGLFRLYLSEYLRQHPNLHHNMTSMVRQLPPTEKGIPLELYVFAATTQWTEYEGIQADIFDHVIAAAPFFGLEIFEEPTGRDLSAALTWGQETGKQAAFGRPE
jgi:miniconductance mechanosensitive channel